jgi:hypothetical protein
VGCPGRRSQTIASTRCPAAARQMKAEDAEIKELREQSAQTAGLTPSF